MPNGDRVFILESLPPKHWVNVSYVTTLFFANPSYVGHEHGNARQVNFRPRVEEVNAPRPPRTFPFFFFRRA
jgi:hypothetical protein